MFQNNKKFTTPSRKLYFIHVPKNGGTSVRQLVEENPQLNIEYVNHLAPLTKIRNKLKLMIWRRESERFCSAVRYAIQNYSHLPNIAKLIDQGINSPDIWRAAIDDFSHPYHHDVMAEVLNVSHYVDGRKLKYKWTYAPQSTWIDFEDFDNILFIRFDSMSEELSRLCFLRTGQRLGIPRLNRTT